MAAKMLRGKYAEEHPRKMAGERPTKQLSVPPAKESRRWLTKIRMWVPSWIGGSHGKGK